MRNCFKSIILIISIFGYLTLSCQLMTKGSCILNQTCSSEVQVCLSVHDLLLPPSMSVKSQEVTHSNSKVLLDDFKRFTPMNEKILNKQIEASIKI